MSRAPAHDPRRALLHGRTAALFSKSGWGGARANAGGARPNSGPKPRPPPPIFRPLGPRWYVLQFAAHREGRAIRALLEGEDRPGRPPRAPFAAELPMTAVRVLEHGRAVTRHRMMFHGYGFVRFEAASDAWHQIAHVDGVVRLFTTTSMTPLPLPVGFVEALVADAPARLSLAASRQTPHPTGARLRVIEGPLTGHPATVVESDGLTTAAAISILGRECCVTLPWGAYETYP